jgi:hypothetical protein
MQGHGRWAYPLINRPVAVTRRFAASLTRPGQANEPGRDLRIAALGPLTMELADSLFRGTEAVEKVALFIRAFVRSGCQQMQLNTLNVDTLRDAQRHPERHRNLVVRVWGWSGYFCELDESYQNQIIGRHIYGA